MFTRPIHVLRSFQCLPKVYLENWFVRTDFRKSIKGFWLCLPFYQRFCSLNLKSIIGVGAGLKVTDCCKPATKVLLSPDISIAQKPNNSNKKYFSNCQDEQKFIESAQKTVLIGWIWILPKKELAPNFFGFEWFEGQHFWSIKQWPKSCSIAITCGLQNWSIRHF